MKRIVYTRPDGGLSIVVPAEGGRLANSVQLADGTVLAEKVLLKAEGLIEVDGKKESAVYGFAPTPVSLLYGKPWPAPGVTAEWAETDDEFAARVAARDVPAGISFAIVDESAIPADRSFRNAWQHDNGVISHDMTKCRAIQKDKLRAERASLLAAQDVAFQRAIAAGSKPSELAAIETEKQRLRDITKLADAAKTPVELRTLTAAK